MTENTVPRVAKFADLRVGMTIEWVRTRASGTAITYTGVVSKVTDRVARDAGDGILAWLADDSDPHVTLRILADPAPALPTAPGTVIRIGDNVWLLVEDGGWHCSRYLRGPHPEDATDWEVIHDPNAPKADATDWQKWVDEVKRSNCGVEVGGVYIQTAERYWAGQADAADPLDESDHRDRIDKRGVRITRRRDKHWHAETASECNDQCPSNTLADWNAACGPLRFADEVAA